MSDPDANARRQEVESWLAVAEMDRRSAVVCLAADPPLPAVAAFHCQQAAEKLFKGFLVQTGMEFRKTHDLRELGDAVVSVVPDAAELVRQTEDWTIWAVAYRYPSAEGPPEPEPSATELRHAVGIVERLASALRSLATEGEQTDRNGNEP